MKRISILVLMLVPALTFAHAGHNFFGGSTLAHYLTSPVHIVPIIAVISIISYKAYKRKIVQRRS